jgi:peptidyl-prolyl cis-trans isomerase D
VAKATPRVKLAILQREVTPSSKTISARYNEAKQFIVTNRSEDMFRSAVAEMHMTLYPAYNLDKNADKVSDLKQSRPIVRWAYEAKEEGTISDVFECGDKFVVALLTSIDEDEYRPLADVQVELRRQATNEKKAEYLKEQVKGLTTLQDIAAKWNTTVQTANGVTLSGYQFGNMGPEYKAMGKAVTIEENKLSDVIAGNQGAIVLMTTSRTKAEGEMNAETEIAQLNQRRAYMLPYQIINLLEQNSEVEDNRSNFQ